ncbi:MAG: Asp-tRNA(Asn)/Glu-tRNA(Gln) amidotransferase subunit GatC [Clostridia bacterium]|nr:Asp-tRNA(Asn)/Glu-tRNA(Gln) amidotransferase subunit GatC [Clostridia bacterium]
MELNFELVNYLSKLSKIELSDFEEMQIIEELSEMVKYIDVLKTLNTDNADELSHVFEITNVMRPDEVGESLPREDILKNAPNSNEASFIVPKAVD